jgi:lycopene cyclase domain-containing protein
MTGLSYLGLLLLGIGAMLSLDWRFRLFFWHSARGAWIAMAVGVGVLLLVDGAGIAFGLFLRGESEFASGIVLAPHLPLEEPVFLAFLVLTTAVLYTGASRVAERIGDGRRT